MNSINDARLPARPLRNWLLAWQAHTGDPVDVVARGFGLDVAWVTELLGPEPPLLLHRSEALAASAALRIGPGDLWPGEKDTADAALETDPLWADVTGSLVDVFTRLR